jgi:hypothetical protein
MAPTPTGDNGQAPDVGASTARSIELTFDKLAGIYLEHAPSALAPFQADAQVSSQLTPCYFRSMLLMGSSVLSQVPMFEEGADDRTTSDS